MARKVNIGRKSKSRINTQGVPVGTTAVQISQGTNQLEAGVQIVADAGNSGTVFVGVRPTITAGTADATDGFPLQAGESFLLPVSQESEIWMIATVASQQTFIVSF